MQAVAQQLGNAATFHFDDYGEAMQQPDDGLRWIADGADLTQFVLPQFGEDVARLRRGEAVTTPTGRHVEPAPYLVVEEPFGRSRSDMAAQVDFSVCIELPMEVALARRLLDAAERWSGPPEQRLDWITTYLKMYLFEGMREVYIAINEAVKASSDLVLDGTAPIEDNARRVVEAVLARQARS